MFLALHLNFIHFISRCSLLSHVLSSVVLSAILLDTNTPASPSVFLFLAAHLYHFMFKLFSLQFCLYCQCNVGLSPYSRDSMHFIFPLMPFTLMAAMFNHCFSIFSFLLYDWFEVYQICLAYFQFLFMIFIVGLFYFFLHFPCGITFRKVAPFFCFCFYFQLLLPFCLLTLGGWCDSVASVFGQEMLHGYGANQILHCLLLFLLSYPFFLFSLNFWRARIMLSIVSLSSDLSRLLLLCLSSYLDFCLLVWRYDLLGGGVLCGLALLLSWRFLVSCAALV